MSTMLGMYKHNVAKIQIKKSDHYREKHIIGHEKYCEPDNIRRNRKRRKFAVRQSKSATDINSTLLTEIPGRSTPRSISSDQVKDAGKSQPMNHKEKSGGKMESFVKWFSCVILNAESENTSRQNGTYAYTALEPETNVHERLELEKKARDRAQNMCIQHLSPRYSFIDQLNDIGSRVTKHWFIVRDSSVKTERLLTFVPRGPNCPIQFGPETRSVFLDLFLALQHPYIYPILDMNFKEIGNKWYIFATLPFNEKGSLKDFIYKSRWQDNWSQKYSQRSSGLPLSQVQRLGRQILEALLFLKKRGFPPCGHLHSGNVILQNGVARLTGLENTLLGYTSRIQPIIWSRAQSEPSAVDSLCFGHVLFEMCAGYELDTAQPTPGNLLDLHQYPQVVEVLDFIFENPEMKLPTIEELLLCDLFRNIDLREMRNQAQSTQVFKSSLTPMAVELLNDVKKFQSGRRRTRNQPEASPEAESSNSSQRERSISSGGSEAEADDEDAYDADANSEPEIIPNKEHRCLSLHNGSSNRIINFHPADMR